MRHSLTTHYLSLGLVILVQVATGDIGLNFKDGRKQAYYFDTSDAKVHTVSCTGVPLNRDCPGLKPLNQQSYADFAFRVHAMELIPDPWNTHEGLKLIQVRIEKLFRDEADDLAKKREKELIQEELNALSPIQKQLSDIQSTLLVKLNKDSDRTLEEGLHFAFETIYWTDRPLWWDAKQSLLWRLASPGDGWKGIKAHCRAPWQEATFFNFSPSKKRLAEVFGIDWAWLPSLPNGGRAFKYPLSQTAIAIAPPTKFQGWEIDSVDSAVPILCQWPGRVRKP